MWHGSLLCWKMEWDKSTHTSPDSFCFTWLEGSRLTAQGRIIANSPMQHHWIASQLLNHLYWLCLTTAQSCPASQGHDAPCKHRMEPWHHFQRASRTVIPAEMDILVFVYIDSPISTVCLPFRENLKLHFQRQISKCIVHTLTDRIFPNAESWQQSIKKFLDLSVSELGCLEFLLPKVRCEAAWVLSLISTQTHCAFKSNNKHTLLYRCV